MSQISFTYKGKTSISAADMKCGSFAVLNENHHSIKIGSLVYRHVSPVTKEYVYDFPVYNLQARYQDFQNVQVIPVNVEIIATPMEQK